MFARPGNQLSGLPEQRDGVHAGFLPNLRQHPEQCRAVHACSAVGRYRRRLPPPSHNSVDTPIELVVETTLPFSDDLRPFVP
jgi:hypothetical protein